MLTAGVVSGIIIVLAGFAFYAKDKKTLRITRWSTVIGVMLTAYCLAEKQNSTGVFWTAVITGITLCLCVPAIINKIKEKT